MSSNFIRHINKYVTLTGEDELLLLNYAKPLQVEKKHYLLKEGRICKDLYFVEKGCLRMFFISDKGTEQITQFAIENWWLADYMSYDRQVPSQFYIQAVENSELYIIDHASQDILLKQLPQMERYFRLILQKAYAAAQMRIKYVYDLSKEERYQQFVTLFPGFAQRIPQYMMASYLGLTPEYLSEIRKKVR